MLRMQSTNLPGMVILKRCRPRCRETNFVDALLQVVQPLLLVGARPGGRRIAIDTLLALRSTWLLACFHIAENSSFGVCAMFWKVEMRCRF